LGILDFLCICHAEPVEACFAEKHFDKLSATPPVMLNLFQHLILQTLNQVQGDVRIMFPKFDKNRIMEILVYGIGGVGGYFGGKLANAGFNVSMIARGEHLKAVQKNGLEIESLNGNFKVKPKMTTSDISEVPTPDFVILGIKSWQIPSVATELKPIIGENTMVLPLQNGADNVEKLLEILPRKNVLAGLCFVVSFIEKPGKIKSVAALNDRHVAQCLNYLKVSGNKLAILVNFEADKLIHQRIVL